MNQKWNSKWLGVNTKKIEVNQLDQKLQIQ